LGTYEWIRIEKFAPIPGKYTNCDFNIRTYEEYVSVVGNIDLPDISPRLFFWDIETFASNQDEFPCSSNPGDFIFAISIITVSKEGINGYIIIKGDVNMDLIDKKLGMTLIKVKDEKDLLSNFFALYNTFGPDRQIYYNGDMFDMPYILDRLTIHNFEIPKISKILSLTPFSYTRSYPTPFGQEKAQTLSLPGTEIIDLIHYYRRFYPHFKNHRLDTVSKAFIGEGKTGLTIEEMMGAIRTNNPDKFADVVEYSFVDSLRLQQLWNTTNIQTNLENVCNNLGISIDVLLRYGFEYIINRAVYNIDAGSALIKGKYDEPKHLKDAMKGIYRNVFIYDYSELYREVMLLSKQPVASALANRLEGSPPKLIMTAFYSIYVDRGELLPLFNSMLDSILRTNMIIAMEPFIIRSIGPLKANWLKLLGISPAYVSVSKASYIVIDKNGELETAGLAKLCRPKFQLASDIIKQYLSLVYSNELKNFVVPDIKTLTVDKFILTEKLGDITSAKTDTIKYKLAAQHGTTITTWISVKYIMTLRGPVLLSKIEDNDQLNYEYYIEELDKYLKVLQSLKIYGV
jgi:DNA polymerase elongation subunit (family B)